MQVLVALGANLPFGGDSPTETLRKSVTALVRQGLEVVALSRFFATPCFPMGAGPDYINAAAVLAMNGKNDCTSLLAILHVVEAEFGRERVQRWGMRTLDIDLLAVGDLVLPDAETQECWRTLPADAQIGSTPNRLILPHPRLQDRAFVLVPLADVAPGWVHPLTGQSVKQMLEALPAADRDAVKLL